MATRYRGTPQEVLALDGFIKLMRATDSINAHLSRHVEAAGLTMGQFGVLEALLHLGPMKQCDLGAKLLRSGSNVTVVLDHLQGRGLIRRTRRQDDRRAVEVSLTPDGRRLIAGLFPTHARRITRLFGALSSRDQQRLGALCKTLGRNIPEGDV
jgi:MarR family transcriptional regulator, 2-MHQ and catechol-resistance regulon repressor